ncbi:MAG: class I tRNA ligase family protein, partial [candidate division WOR-3 bacterium]
FVHTACPRCGSEAERETDTLGGFACSSWYFLRFADPHNDREPYSREAVAYWLPVDYYVGGAEHAVGHLLYARFWTKVLYDAGYLPFKEPFNRLRNQGMVLALTPYRKPEPGEILKPGEPGILIRREELSKYKKEELIWVWEKMSKSKGNVVTPDEVVERYSADTLRLYELFVAPFEADIQWEEQGVRGIYRFLNRLWKLFMDFRPHFVRNWREILANTHELSKDARNLRRRTHTTIKRMYTDIEAFRFNTAVAAMMEWSNEMAAFMSKLQTPPAQRTEVAVLSESAENLILVLAPFAPHIADELWERYGFEGFTYEQPYPAYEESVAKAEEITLVVQINGKVRDRLTVPADISEEEMKASALASPRVQAYLDGKQVKRIIVVPGKLVNIVI